MSRKDSFFDKIMFHTELPSETLPGMPIVELFGSHRILIENHKAVTMYGCNEIRIRFSYGQLSICGSCLELVRMSKQQLVITGQIERLTLHRG